MKIADTKIAELRVLVFGSSYLTQVATELIHSAPVPGISLVGHIPNICPPTVQGLIKLPQVTADIAHDVKLCVGYDKKIEDWSNAFNVHPGLLPEYGGCDILHHTIMEGARKQGITFQKMGDKFDNGPIISTIDYPVSPTDTVVDLYLRLSRLFPSFVRYCLELLPEVLNFKGPDIQPRMYYRGRIKPEHAALYQANGEALKILEGRLHG